MVWTARSCRNQILKLLGNATGTPVGRGLGAMAVLGSMARNVGSAARNALSHGNGSGNAGWEETAKDWNETAQAESRTAREMDSQAEGIMSNLPDINEKLDTERHGDNSITDALNEMTGEFGDEDGLKSEADMLPESDTDMDMPDTLPESEADVPELQTADSDAESLGADELALNERETKHFPMNPTLFRMQRMAQKRQKWQKGRRPQWQPPISLWRAKTYLLCLTLIRADTRTLRKWTLSTNL